MTSSETSSTKQMFLAAYDYGMGGLWLIIMARTEAEILEKYPELSIARGIPSWLELDDLLDLHDAMCDIDDEPSGVLSVVVADRRKA